MSRRGNGEGTILRRKDGRWQAQATLGRDPRTGNLQRVCFYGKTRQEAAAKLAAALQGKATGGFVKPSRVTVGEMAYPLAGSLPEAPLEAHNVRDARATGARAPTPCDW